MRRHYGWYLPTVFVVGFAIGAWIESTIEKEPVADRAIVEEWYGATGYKLPTTLGDRQAQVWFAHSAARDSFVSRYDRNWRGKDLFNQLPKWGEK